MSKGTLFIVRSALSEHPALSSIISKEDGVLLRAEACYNASAFVGLGVATYALEQDVNACGGHHRTTGVTVINDAQWVELTLQYQRTISE
ncbi:hypothetical protein EXT46_03465 [Pseudoalteromonas sp. CO325X]|uniref:DsrH/TusB family sulfur metabolism protein n=1 Tax=Pseudoalteromonas TaxID=53246 RepID=UPI0010239CA1|nr:MULTISPECIES: DsrH/TusB family sulfur metabolism protein [Pseudoalteromonas]RZF84385.1 hypothetical protein EXT46_03465 [Pseudoalteromonas sp. CO325X]|tara:strand:- start:11733 stop:12002 length:270 start_codon:yes stop_codon:yes gene_type:complete